MSQPLSTRLEDVCVFRKGKKPSVTFDEPITGSLPYLLIESFDGTRKNFTNDLSCVLCTEDDTLIVCDGARSGLTSFGHRGYVGSTIAALVPDKTKIFPGFLYHFVKSQYDFLNKSVHGAAVPHIERQLLLGLRFHLPPFAEQERIVRILDEAEELKKLRAQADRRTADLIPALFDEMFGDPILNPKQWNAFVLSELCEIKAGPFGSSIKKETYTSFGYRVYGQEQVIANDFSIGDYFISPEKFREMRAYEVKANDLLISLVGTIGKIIIVPHGVEPGIINPRLLRIRIKETNLDVTFLQIVLEHPSLQSALLQIANGQTMGVLNAGILKSQLIPVPPIALQKEFAEKAEQIRALSMDQSVCEQKMESLFQSLLHRAFEGEL